MNARFDHEKLDVYQVELEFIRWSTPLLAEVRTCATASTGEVRDQLDRASLSALLSTAEGNGRRQMRMRAKFFDDARGSATESAACLDALVAKGACSDSRIAEGKDLLVRIASMPTKLVEYFSGERFVREGGAAYAAGEAPIAEDENEDEHDRGRNQP